MHLDPGQHRIGFTSDLHGFHRSIIQYSNRPFRDVFEMNEAIRDRHNQIFEKDDVIFNLGDALLLPSHPELNEPDSDLALMAQDWLKGFVGRIYYLPGNHEEQLNLIQNSWNVLPQIYEITVQDADAELNRQKVVMCHFAMRTWARAHHGTWHLYGHSHSALRNDLGELMADYEYSLSMDVGVDTNDYLPYTYDDIKSHLTQKKFKPTDHHKSKE